MTQDDCVCDEPLRLRALGEVQGNPQTVALDRGSFDPLRNEERPYPLNPEFTIGKTHALIKGEIDRLPALRGLNVQMLMEGRISTILTPSPECLFLARRSEKPESENPASNRRGGVGTCRRR